MIDEIEFRPARADDAVAIRDLTRRAYAKWADLIGREPLPMSADYDAAVRAHQFELAFGGDGLAGLIETLAGSDHWLIENVAVAPEHQRRGLAKRLISRLEARAAAAGVRTIRLYTNKAFAENIRLYLSLGYLIDREEPFRGGTVVHMSKRTSARPEMAI